MRSTLVAAGFLVLTGLASGCAGNKDFAPDIGQSYVLQCTVLGEGAQIRKLFPAAKACLFLDDGSFVAATNDPRRLARIGADGKLIWTRDLHIHHQLKLSQDGKRILTLGSDIREGELGRVRYDDFLILSVATGETLSRWSGYEHRKDFLGTSNHIPTHIRPPDSREGLDYLYEHTHFNSIDEIPENPTARSLPAFRRGNFLVGLNGLGIFAILDSELKQTLWTMNDPLTDGDTGRNFLPFHDLQIIPNGHLLVFNNELSTGVEGSARFAIREIDPVSVKIVWQYPPEHTDIPVAGGGGLQYLPEGILFNVNRMVGGKECGSAFLIDSHGRTIWSLNQTGSYVAPVFHVGTTPIEKLTPTGFPFQDIKKIDLREFLSKSKL